MPALPRSRATSSTASYTFAVPSISRPRDCADCPVHPAEHRCRADECEEQGCTHDDVVFHVCLLLIDQLALGGGLAIDIRDIGGDADSVGVHEGSLMWISVYKTNFILVSKRCQHIATQPT